MVLQETGVNLSLQLAKGKIEEKVEPEPQSERTVTEITNFKGLTIIPPVKIKDIPKAVEEPKIPVFTPAIVELEKVTPKIDPKPTALPVVLPIESKPVLVAEAKPKKETEQLKENLVNETAKENLDDRSVEIKEDVLEETEEEERMMMKMISEKCGSLEEQLSEKGLLESNIRL